LQWLAPVDAPLPSLSVLELAVKWPALHMLQLVWVRALLDW
jgi:hypothetical protein